MTEGRLTIRDRADLARVSMLLQSHGYSIRNLDTVNSRNRGTAFLQTAEISLSRLRTPDSLV